MNTPIYDFLVEYQRRQPTRLHMPGHKGKELLLGPEALDITEIDGADNLYHPEGIIAKSEANASSLFGAHTFYSTEGSSLSIRAMLFLFVRYCLNTGRKPYILAGRNAHKTYINTAALLNIETDWIWGQAEDSYEECRIDGAMLEERLASLEQKPAALYVTTPDYLGNLLPIRELSEVCRRHGMLLLVDNAHGAYLRFLTPSMHPIDLGADLCADSAHKTLPVLTGGAYLHISPKADEFFRVNALAAFEMFGSTSPSYLLMASLDLCNAFLETLPKKLSVFLPKLAALKEDIARLGYSVRNSEPLKLVIESDLTSPGVKGLGCRKMAEALMKEDIYPEYYDAKHLVLMVTVSNEEAELSKLKDVLSALATKWDGLKDTSIDDGPSKPSAPPERVLSAHEAVFCEQEELPGSECYGRILAAASVSCPPAVPVYMMGERIETAFSDERKYRVVKEKR
ncbi:MAG: amino acid decarboxylase [Lachnospiraceae bacterium]|nr:amino acid decarboxylase [Lachnospiraceae bacterium]